MQIRNFKLSFNIILLISLCAGVISCTSDNSKINTNEKEEVVASSISIKVLRYEKVLFQLDKNNLKAELEYTKGFLQSVMKKLSNERFVNSAPPQVVEIEKNKQADAELKIKVIEDRLALLK